MVQVDRRHRHCHCRRHHSHRPLLLQVADSLALGAQRRPDYVEEAVVDVKDAVGRGEGTVPYHGLFWNLSRGLAPFRP